jgi:nucleoside-diphosphate-sugar epimerase
MKKLLIVGFGDIARRVAPRLKAQYALHGLTRRDAEDGAGVHLLRGDLDDPDSLTIVAQDWDAVLHFAPPGDSGEQDLRTRNLIAVFKAAKILPRKLLYISTSGVYGDCGGAWVDEERPPRPQSGRGKRRVDAETVLRRLGVPLVILRVPGIYAADRLPIERLKQGTPVLREEDDVYTNHIHADDLAQICASALERAPAGGVYNASDDSEMKMGDWFDFVAERNGLPAPPRIARAEAALRMPARLLSFMQESRRLSNRRMKQELGIRLAYPTVRDGVPDTRRAEQ